MTDAELRSLVQQIVADRLRDRVPATTPAPFEAAHPTGVHHPSLALYVSVVNVGDACVIEPSVPCEHCGYCRSHGH